MSRATGDDKGVDPDAIGRRMRERAERTNRRQVDLATERLDDDYHDALEALCRNLTEGVLAGPSAALRVAGECEDAELARAVATLFDVEPSGETPETIEREAGEDPLPVEP